MGKYFSDAVEEGLQYIYYDVRAGKGEKGLAILRKASEEGDGDASCILARCYSGQHYVWSGHNFPENHELAEKYLHKAVEQGSALGILIAMRCGELTPKMEASMPFADLQEVFDIVLAKAEAGDAFCQYVIGNVYFWWDFMDIQEVTPQSFPNKKEFEAYVRENVLKCEEWFHKALRGGIHMAANNLNSLYTEGDEDIIKPRPQLAKDLYKIGAQTGHPDSQWSYADQLWNEGKKEESIYWYQQAAEGGQFECWYNIAEEYLTGAFVEKDVDFAIKCYENALKQKKNTNTKLSSASDLGWMYCDGIRMARNGEKAFPLLKLAVENGKTDRIAWLGKCYFFGWGTMPDYVKARECFERATERDKEATYMLGVIYAQGLGVAEDIGKGVKMLKAASGIPEAKNELAKYKRTLFGKWVRKQ